MDFEYGIVATMTSATILRPNPPAVTIFLESEANHHLGASFIASILGMARLSNDLEANNATGVALQEVPTYSVAFFR
jgi:hypothetical protein